MTDEYLEVLRERYGPDAADRQAPGDGLDDDCLYCGRPDCRGDCDDDGDPWPDDVIAGEWYGVRPVEVVEIPGVS